MATTELMREIYELPLVAKFYVIEETLKAIKREEMAQAFEPQTFVGNIIDHNEKAIEERRRKLLENNKKYSVNFQEIGYKFNRDEANDYD